MKKVAWYLNRLKAMNMSEIYWRFQQKNLQRQEKSNYYIKNMAIYEFDLPDKLKNLNAQVNRISINLDNKRYTIFKEQNLFETYSYKEYKKSWAAGFQTENTWPTDECSYDISISQREEIGDIRTNWELNRHYQFVGMAKSFYITGDVNIFKDIKELFYDWNEKNHFLCGVEWTSAMEIAIRVNSWIYMYCFIDSAFKKYNMEDDKLLKDISRAIVMMTDYITKHRARYSSANNHLIIEMYAVGMSGIFFDYKPWKDLSFGVLTNELPRQNYSDGVNKEMSLHYQSFMMEAYGLMMLEMRNNHIKIPQVWIEYLSKMSEFLCDCCGKFGETIIFGDNDEGKILDLSGEKFDYYRYVLDLMGFVLPKRYSRMDNIHENLCWILQDDFKDCAMKKNCYISQNVKCYREGGYTVWRSRDEKVLIGIDHADLGYGSLAAHGHADALSFQMFIEGRPVFVDPGTYNYHVPIKLRDEFKVNKNHNTVYINGKNQAEVQGAFLWGKRYKCKDVFIDTTHEGIKLDMSIEYDGILHNRRIIIYESDEICMQIIDKVRSLNIDKVEQIFIIGPSCRLDKDKIKIGNYIIELSSGMQKSLTKTHYSSMYNKKEIVDRIVYWVENSQEYNTTINTTILIKIS